MAKINPIIVKTMVKKHIPMYSLPSNIVEADTFIWDIFLPSNTFHFVIS